jgi:DNA polymerase
VTPVTAARAADSAALRVRDTAAAAGDWPALRLAASGCVACPELAAGRTRVVFGQWPAGARIALLGEAPGADEDATGEPFVGRSGRLLDRLLTEAGLRRDDVAVLNVLKCRPPGNRKPAAVEAARCRGWLDRQLAFVDPELLVPLGGSATEAVLGRGTQVSKARGRAWLRDGRLVIPSYHPSAALRFGPRGEPAAALAADLATLADWLTALTRAGARYAMAAPDDAAEVAALTAAAFDAEPEPVAAVAAELAAGGAVARADGVLVAAARTASHRGDPRALWVRRLAVAPDARRRGVATTLLRWLGAAARAAGHTALALGTRDSAPATLAARAGFTRVADHGGWVEWRQELT